MDFPRLAARTLAGQDRTLPDDLPAQRTLVLVAFHQWHQRQVDAWIARAADAGWAPDLHEQPTGHERAVIEVPCLGRRWIPGRAFIDGGMASGIRIPEVLARTWTAYTDTGAVQRALGTGGGDHTWAGVVAAGGEVLEHAMGVPNDRSWPLIAAVMEGLR